MSVSGCDLNWSMQHRPDSSMNVLYQERTLDEHGEKRTSFNELSISWINRPFASNLEQVKYLKQSPAAANSDKVHDSRPCDTVFPCLALIIQFI